MAIRHTSKPRTINLKGKAMRTYVKVVSRLENDGSYTTLGIYAERFDNAEIFRSLEHRIVNRFVTYGIVAMDLDNNDTYCVIHYKVKDDNTGEFSETFQVHARIDRMPLIS